MIGAERLLADREGAFVEFLGFVSALGLINRGQIREGRCHIGMVGAERLLAYRERAFVQSFGIAITALFQKCESFLGELVRIFGQFVAPLGRSSHLSKQRTKPTQAHDVHRLT